MQTLDTPTISEPVRPTLMPDEPASLYRRLVSEWRTTFDALDSFVLIVEDDDRIVRCNRAASNLIGDQPVHLSRLPPRQPWRGVQDLVTQARTAGTARSTLLADEATGRTWELNLAVPADATFYVVLGADVTPVVRLQEAIHRSETMSAMGALVAGVAHEVRNPLFSISATVDAFEAQFGGRPEQRPYIQTLRDGVNRLARLTGDLLEYGRPIELQLELRSVNDTLRDAISACEPRARIAGVRVLERFETRPFPLRIDSERLMQVFVNLIENAIQHSQPGQGVLVDSQNLDVAAPRAPMVVCTVQDRGPGFRVEDLRSLFSPFFTRRRGGTGLGLAIARRIVEEHAGSIEATNRVDGGAVVSVRLPAYPEER